MIILKEHVNDMLERHFFFTEDLKFTLIISSEN